ncbi:MAG: SgcJ/EcaC family oxidoreductase [Gemmatimonadota bacterium]|nr:SgcJ/EcaC family oxidoreductase [Gemmatimonadota bacterium]MDH5197875.1 SgcJ/EcaC family oxidoreductase [Gemmatimonadota bacterium]
MTSRLTAALVALVALTACQPAETIEQMHARIQTESNAVHPIIETQVAKFVAAFNAQQAEGMAAVYAPDAVMMPPDMPGVTGRDAILANLEGMFAQMPPNATMTIRVLNVTANGPVAVDRGQWTISGVGPDGATMEMHGKYLAEWHQIDGEWLMVSDIWNNDAPMPPM